MMDDVVVSGIRLWLKARQVEAIRANRKEVYETIEVLLSDLTMSARTHEYPWEMLVRGFVDKQKGKVT